MAFVLVAIGSALGGMARYGTYLLMARLLGQGFPWGTLTVNILGSVVIGWFAAAAPGHAVNPRLFVMTGICGGYTTFSAFSLDTLNMMRNGEQSKALVNIGASLVLCGMAVAFGHFLGSARK